MKALILLLIFTSYSQAKTQIQLVDWSSPEGIQRLSRSKAKVDFFKLANHFQGQPNSIACGPTTGAIILNTMRIRTGAKLPKTVFTKEDGKFVSKKYDPRFERYTPKTFFNANTDKIKTWAQVFGKPTKDGKKDFGIQLRQLHNLFKSHKVNSELRVVTEKLPAQKIKKEIIRNLKKQGDYVVINYKRKILNQKGGGHISPIGAYDKDSDSFLIMDVNPNKDNWVWVKSTDLIASMRTFDTVENRGYLLLQDR